MATTTIKAVEVVRAIRDQQASALAGKTPREVVAFFRAAGDAARRDARSTGSVSVKRGMARRA